MDTVVQYCDKIEKDVVHRSMVFMIDRSIPDIYWSCHLIQNAVIQKKRVLVLCSTVEFDYFRHLNRAVRRFDGKMIQLLDVNFVSTNQYEQFYNLYKETVFDRVLILPGFREVNNHRPIKMKCSYIFNRLIHPSPSFIYMLRNRANNLSTYYDVYLRLRPDHDYRIILSVYSEIKSIEPYDCPICLESFSDSVAEFHGLHRFCVGCTKIIEKSTKVKCPLCRDQGSPVYYRQHQDSSKKTYQFISDKKLHNSEFHPIQIVKNVNMIEPKQWLIIDAKDLNDFVYKTDQVFRMKLVEKIFIKGDIFENRCSTKFD